MRRLDDDDVNNVLFFGLLLWLKGLYLYLRYYHFRNREDARSERTRRHRVPVQETTQQGTPIPAGVVRGIPVQAGRPLVLVQLVPVSRVVPTTTRAEVQPQSQTLEHQESPILATVVKTETAERGRPTREVQQTQSQTLEIV